jgi:hypothetical protein
MKKVFLDNLPKKKNSNLTDWFKCKNLSVKFTYNGIEGSVEIINIRRENNKTILSIKYLNNICDIWTGNFIRAQLGEVLGVNTKKHYYEVGDIIELSTGKIKIKELIRYGHRDLKGHIFECLECGWTNGLIDEGNLKKGQGCGCCANKVPVLGINTIYDTDKWMLPYFIDPENAKIKTFGSNDKNLLHCPICKIPKPDMKIVTLHRDKDIHCEVCWDGFSYGEKYTYSMLKQLGITQVKRHKYFEWSKNVYSEIESLCGSKEYDFHINIDNQDCIIETNGLQHYEECSFSRRSLYEEQENDKLKEEIAIKNNIKRENYIVIDCRYSNSQYIKNSILNNEKMKNKFDLSIINWDKCEQDSLEPYLIKAVDYYNNGIGHMEIAKIMDIGFKTVKRYLKRAREYNLCNFKTIYELKIENKLKAIQLWNEGIHNASEIARQLNLDSTVISDYLIEAENEGIIEYKKFVREASKKGIRNIEYNKEFVSINQASILSEELFGVKLYRKQITTSCDTGKAYNGLHFQYINKDKIAN